MGRQVGVGRRDKERSRAVFGELTNGTGSDCRRTIEDVFDAKRSSLLRIEGERCAVQDDICPPIPARADVDGVIAPAADSQLMSGSRHAVVAGQIQDFAQIERQRLRPVVSKVDGFDAAKTSIGDRSQIEVQPASSDTQCVIAMAAVDAGERQIRDGKEVVTSSAMGNIGAPRTDQDVIPAAANEHVGSAGSRPGIVAGRSRLGNTATEVAAVNDVDPCSLRQMRRRAEV